MMGWIYKKKDLCLKQVLHNDLEAYVSSGYGGKPIAEWPFYRFISMWIGGRAAEAENLWVDWLLGEFARYGSVSKRRGGMYQGSVHRNACNYSDGDNVVLTWCNPQALDRTALCHGAQELVERRIQMIDSMKNNGWKGDLSDRICAVRASQGRYVLKGGHHRAATLYALGYSVLPTVYVYSRLGWRLLGWVKAVKKFVCSKVKKVIGRG